MSAVRKNLVLDARMLPAVLADQSHIRNVDRRFLLDDAALDVRLRVGRVCRLII